MTKTGKYDHAIRLNVTEDQNDLIRKAARLAGKPFTEWARERLLVLAEEQIREHRERQCDAAE